MNSLEFSLQVAVLLHCLTHFLVNHELVWNGKWHQEFRCVSFSLQVCHTGQHPPEHMVNGLLVAMDNFTAKVWIKVRWIS